MTWVVLSALSRADYLLVTATVRDTKTGDGHHSPAKSNFVFHLKILEQSIEHLKTADRGSGIQTFLS